MSTSTSSNSSASDMRGFIDKNASKSDPLCGMSADTVRFYASYARRRCNAVPAALLALTYDSYGRKSLFAETALVQYDGNGFAF
jgi:hypothetical protein